MKQTAGKCAVGVEMKRRKPWTHSKCPRCDELYETSTHVLQYTGEGTGGIWEKAIKSFRQHLAEQLTNNQVADLICASLSAWRQGIQPRQPRSYLLGLQQAFVEQTDIGWGAALEGRWSELWVEIQERHFRKLKKQRSGKRWLTTIIRKLWNIAWDLWQHRNDVQAERQIEERRMKNAVNIRYEYGLGSTGLDQNDRRLFAKTMEEILTANIHYQDAWVRRITMARKRSATNTITREQRNYLNFYNLLRTLRRREPSGTIPASQQGPRQPIRREIVRLPRTTNR